MTLTHEDVEKILKIIDGADYDDIRLEVGDLKLHLKRHGGSTPGSMEKSSGDWDIARGNAPESLRADGIAAPAVTSEIPRNSHDQVIPDGLVAVRAPMLGVFYRAPSPGEKPFVEVGDKISPSDTVCLVEVMKLFNSIKAGVAGTVVKILVEDSTLVEHGQTLMLIEQENLT